MCSRLRPVRSSAAATETQIVMPLDHLPALSAAALESENRAGSVMTEALVLRRPRQDEEDEFVRAHRAARRNTYQPSPGQVSLQLRRNRLPRGVRDYGR